MLDQMATKYSVDATRIYAAGLSEGGLMAIKVGCSMADRIAAIAPVGAAMPGQGLWMPSPIIVVLSHWQNRSGTEENL